MNLHALIDQRIAELKAGKANPARAESFTAFRRFAMAAWGKEFVPARHLEILDEALTDVLRYVESGGQTGTARLMIAMPPRYGKSTTVAQLFALYALARNPHYRIMLASYGARLAGNLSYDARDLARREAMQQRYPTLALRADAQEQADWKLAAGGGMLAVGAGGAITGLGGDILIGDDLIKNAAEAQSQLMRDRTWRWYQEVFLTRRQPGAAMVLIGTRWHVDDVQGRLLKQEPEKWRILRFPAIAEAEDRDAAEWRAPGAALWPERYPLAEVLDVRGSMSDYSFGALYQQRPVPAEGGLFKRAMLLDAVIDAQPPIVRKVRYWDVASSEKTAADYTVGVLLGITHGQEYIVLDVVRFHAELEYVPRRIATIAQLDGPTVIQGVESVFYQSRIARSIQAMPEMHHHAIREVRNDRDKTTRIIPVLDRLVAGRVKFVRAGWTEGLFDELCSFPQGLHDDQVDALAGAYALADAFRRPIEVTVGRYA